MKFPKDMIEAYFEHGVDLTNRRIFIEDIESKEVGTAIRALYLLETESENLPCELFISSTGGDVCEALALHDVIQTVKCPVHCFCYGKCMSAALLLLAGGEPGERWVAPHVSFMYHDWSSEIEGTASQIAAEVKESDRVNEIWLRLLTKYSTKEYRFWNQKSKQPADFYFGSEESLEWGLADAVWSEK